MEVKVVYQNMVKSEALNLMVEKKIQPVFEKFQALRKVEGLVHISMENSQFQAGQDSFQVKVILHLKKNRRPLVICKNAENPYEALSVVHEALQENLHRWSEKKRKTVRHEQRKARQKVKWLQPAA
jgi:ribosome-associated translation inhibitor RaiA